MDPLFCNRFRFAIGLVVFVLKVLGSGKIVLASGLLVPVVVYCFVFACACTHLLSLYVDDM